jgi:hypothetical protein
MSEAAEVVITEIVPTKEDRHHALVATRDSNGTVRAYFVVIQLDGRWYESVHAVPSGVRGTRLTEMLTELATREAKGGGHRVRILGQTE